MDIQNKFQSLIQNNKQILYKFLSIRKKEKNWWKKLKLFKIIKKKLIINESAFNGIEYFQLLNIT